MRCPPTAATCSRCCGCSARRPPWSAPRWAAPRSLIAASEEPERAWGLVLVDIVPGFAASGVQRVRAFMTANPDGFAKLDEAAAAVSAYNPNRSRRTRRA